MPENMTLKSYLYRYTTIGNTPAPIERNNFKGAVALVDDAAIARAMAMKESGRIIGSRDVAAEQQQRHHMTSMFSAPEAGDTIPPLSSENGSKCAVM